jgi:PAS domain S-box-containing protein
MIKNGNARLILFFTVLTFVITLTVIFAWEKLLNRPVFAWIDAHYSSVPADERWRIEQRVEHFFISTTVDVIVVTLLLRLVNRQQHRLKASEERYRALFEQANDGIGLLRASDFRLAEVNSQFARTLDETPAALLGRRIDEFSWESAEGSQTCPLRKLLRGEAAGDGELALRLRSGNKRPVLFSFCSLVIDGERLILLMVRDISERKRLAEEKDEMQLQLFQSSKLASIGELSAGVAHEINNPLNGIINFAQLLKDSGAARAPAEERMLDGIIDEGQRITKIVRDLLTFARHDAHDRARVNIAEAIATSVSLFGHQLEKDDIKLELEVARNLPPVCADNSRLRQVIVNLISNAQHALRAKGAEARVFRIKAYPWEKDGRRFARLEFYDNGTGIKPQYLSKIFDPFFTTRRDKGGTGLGLSLSFAIIREYGGTIAVESLEGEFTRFIINLPAVNGQEADGNADDPAGG